MKTLLFACCIIFYMTAMSLAERSHYTINRIDIEFNGKSQKIIYTSRVFIYDDVNLEDWKVAAVPTSFNISLDDASVIVKPINSEKKKEYGKRDAYLSTTREDFELVSDSKAYLWNLGKIEPNTQIDYRYEFKDNDGLGGRYHTLIGDAPVDTGIVCIHFPSDDWRLKYSVDNGEIAYYDSTDQAVFAWYNLPSRTKSTISDAPYDYWPGLWCLFESKKGEADISNWADVYKWESGRLSEKISLSQPPQMLQIASTPEKILAAIDGQCHYVAIELGDGGYVPAPSDDVWKKGYGDCKGLAMLFVNWMKAAGFDAWPVLVLSDDKRLGNIDFPSPYIFNHEIAAYVTPSNDTAYQDITAEFCPLGQLPISLYGCLAFPLRPDSKPLRLGASPIGPDTAYLQIDGALTEDGTLVGNLNYKLHGQSAILQNWLLHQTRNVNSESKMKDYMAYLVPQASVFKITVDSGGTLDLNINAGINISRFCFPQDSLIIFRPWILSFFQNDLKSDTTVDWPIILRRNIVFELSYRVRLNHPISRQGDNDSISQDLESFDYSLKDNSHDDSLITNLSLYLRPLILTPEELIRYKYQKKDMIRSINSAVIFLTQHDSTR